MQVVALVEEEDGNFGVWFPDFPGCVTGADSLDEAVPKAVEALAFHVEGLAEDGPLPVPRTLAELRKDPEFRADTRRALLVLVPYDPPSRAIRLNITLDESLLARVDRAAETAGETRSGYLAEAARRRLAGAAGLASNQVDGKAADGVGRGRFGAKPKPKPRRVLELSERPQRKLRGKR